MSGYWIQTRNNGLARRSKLIREQKPDLWTRIVVRVLFGWKWSEASDS